MAIQTKEKVVAIVDDDELMRIALQGMLNPWDCRHKRLSQRSIPELCQQQQAACLIADIRMSGMSGLELQAQLNAEHCRIPTSSSRHTATQNANAGAKSRRGRVPGQTV